MLKARVKSSKRSLRARVAVRLERDDDAAVEAALRGVERRLDLGRVMAVVVDDHHVAALAAFASAGCPTTVKRRCTPWKRGERLAR